MNSHDINPVEAPADPSRWQRLPLAWKVTTWATLSLAGAALVVITILTLSGNAYRVRPIGENVASVSLPTTHERDIRRRLTKLSPRGVYVVVDTARNRLQVYKNGELQRDAICSTGTGIVLRDPRNGKNWVFDTPLGERRVLGKRRDPVWAKPEWAFIEEGFLPSTDPRDRFDDVSLGDFALDLGDGYLIHGTLFQSLLGRPVTHGCIRLGDEDLTYVYHTVPLGAAVYLF